MTQADFARRLDRAQPAVAAIERTEDHLVSTIRAVLGSHDGHLVLTAYIASLICVPFRKQVDEVKNNLGREFYEARFTKTLQP